jgi:hypothetical protein
MHSRHVDRGWGAKGPQPRLSHTQQQLTVQTAMSFLTTTRTAYSSQGSSGQHLQGS